MNAENIKLIEPTVELKTKFLAMVEEHITIGEHKIWQYDQAVEDFAKYVQDRLDWKKGKNLPKDWIPASTFWLVRDESIILGTSSLRHKLTKNLRNLGGHIGYNIRPSERRKGYGTLILALTLEKAREFGLTRVLVTCDEDNIASAKIIEKNGGRLENTYISKELKQPKRRYWIEL
jgi:predicted acetyltransferase